MIDAYQKQLALMDIGYEEEYLETLTNSQLTTLWLEEIAVRDMIDAIREKGESDNENYRFYISGLEGVCNVLGHTDIIAALACRNQAGDDVLAIHLTVADDSSSIFVEIYDLFPEVIDIIYDQIMGEDVEQ